MGSSLLSSRKKGEKISEIISEVEDKSLARVRMLANQAKGRIADNNFYKSRNLVVKNLGAELFEADCSTLFDYVFGNSLWLGAKHRGSSLPDGFTAFPILHSKTGCFVWDSKFSEGTSVVMGEFTKNKRYIEEASKNVTIKLNGGLKGFVFVSNKSFPDSFVKKYLPLTAKRRIKITFLRSHQLKTLADYYWSHEKLILNNINAKNIFIRTMTYIFFQVAKNRKCEIISDGLLKSLLDSDKVEFKKLKAGRKLTV